MTAAIGNDASAVYKAHPRLAKKLDRRSTRDAGREPLVALKVDVS
jgi:hypothetical protein